MRALIALVSTLAVLSVPLAVGSHVEPVSGPFEVECQAQVVVVVAAFSHNCGGGECFPADGVAAATGTWDLTLSWTPSEDGYATLNAFLFTVDENFRTVAFDGATGASPLSVSVHVDGTETFACFFADGEDEGAVQVQLMRHQAGIYTFEHRA